METGNRIHERAETLIARLAAEALEAARVQAPVKTGRLKNSISMRCEGGKASVFTDCPYAAAVELGSKNAPPQPFMTPALHSVRVKIGGR